MISHPDKVLFPDDGITKGDLAHYYETVAPVMVRHLRGRPVTMERYPAGIAEKGFWQKDVSRGFPSWLRRVDVPKKDGVVHHPVINSRRALLWVANQNAITLHVWTSREPNLQHPDLCVFDLDPSNDEPGKVREAALGLRALLEELSLPSWVKTSGSRGFHIVVPLDRRTPGHIVTEFAGATAAVLVSRAPDLLTLEFSRAGRRGRIYVDTGRNGYGATFAAAYTVRARTGAPVSAPCTWEELEQGRVEPRSFTLRNMPERLAAAGDIWEDLHSHRRSLRRPLKRLHEFSAKITS